MHDYMRMFNEYMQKVVLMTEENKISEAPLARLALSHVDLFLVKPARLIGSLLCR